MRTSRFKKMGVWIGSLLLTGSAVSAFLAQNTQPSPTVSPTVSPSPSSSPIRVPSPTPIPEIQNFHQWGSITVFNGLPSDSVRAIAQTPDGVMWFGTDNGLARFDGRRIRKIALAGGETDRVLALEVSPAGELWIGTRAGALIYSENRFERVANTENVGITTILFDGEVYLGTDTGSVLRAARDERGVPTANPLLAAPVTGEPLGITRLVKVEGKLLAGTAGRGVLAMHDGASSEFATTPRPIFVNALSKGDNESLWFGTDAPKGASGIYLQSGDAKLTRISAPTARVMNLEVNDGGLWAGTERSGLFHVTGSKLTKTYTFANTSGGLRSDTIFTLFTDREGVLWIGTNRGVSRFDRQGLFQQTVSDIPNSNFIRTLTWPLEGLFAGSNRGLFKYDREKWNRVPGFEERSIHDVHTTGDLVTLVATSTGTYDLRGRLITPGDTRNIVEFERTYAAVMGRGVVDITTGKQEVVFAEPTACSLFAGPGRLWIGTVDRGLFSYDGKAVKLEISPEVLKSGAIRRITSDADTALWLAAEHGVFRILDGQVEKIIDVQDAREIFLGRHEAWVATTTRGLLHARRDDRFGWLVSAIGFEQGLPSEKAFSVVPHNGLLIGTNRGVVSYKPATIAPKLIPVRVVSQRAHDLSELASVIALDYPQNSLLIEVSGQSSRTFPEEFQYAFVLKNAGGEEIDKRLSNDSQYSPADLAPGDYTIESIAFNRDLLASDPLTVSFSVARAPFPWTATALGVLLGLSLIALVWAIVERRRIKQRNRELAAARFDLANEAERERSRIARDLHDQTLADLRNLMMATDKHPNSSVELRHEIESISTDIRRICEDLSPSVLENVGLVAALEFLVSHTIENYKFSADENLEERIKLPLNVQLQIYRITQEVLTNITRHSTATEVEMRVEMSEDELLLLTIRDNGQQFDPEESLGKGRGVANIRSRATFINAIIDWTHQREGGNVFTLRIKK